MSAELLRHAASQIRGEWGEGNAMGGAWHREQAFHLAVADWLEAVAAIHWPKRHDRRSESHYNAMPPHDDITDCDESCWTEGTICNGCGTDTCKPEITAAALAVARAYLGTTS